LAPLLSVAYAKDCQTFRLGLFPLLRQDKTDPGQENFQAGSVLAREIWTRSNSTRLIIAKEKPTVGVAKEFSAA
jgi:hypothetical protein